MSPPVREFDLYAELGVPLDAGIEAIERAWRSRVRDTHPDHASLPDARDATERTVRLNLAREWLVNPSKRARYDGLRVPTATAAEEREATEGGTTPPRSNAALYRRASAALALIAAAVLSATLLLGVGTNYVTVVTFLLSTMLLGYQTVAVATGAAWSRRNRRFASDSRVAESSAPNSR